MNTRHVGARGALVAVASALLVLTSVGTAAAAAGDWTTYGNGNARTGYNAAETAITPATAPNLQLAWTASASAGPANWVTSQPVVADGLVYWGSWDGYERASTTSGALVWQTYIGRQAPPASCNATYWDIGVPATATVVGSVVYVAAGNGVVDALDAATGAVDWSTQVGGANDYIYSATAVYAGNLYVGVASSPPDCPLVTGRVFELDASSGALLHTLTVSSKKCTGATVWGAITIDEASGRLFFATGNSGTAAGIPTDCTYRDPFAQAVVSTRATLGVIAHWQVPTTQAPGDSDFGSTPTLFTTPGAHNKLVALVGAANKNGVFYAFKRNGVRAGPVWQFQVAAGGDCAGCGAGSIVPAAFDGTNLYVGGGGTTVAGAPCAGSVASLSPATGTPQWQHCFTDGPVIGALAAAPGIVIAAEGNHLVVLSAATGDVLFSHRTALNIWGSPSIADGTIYVGDQSGTLYAFALPAGS
jgi:polyvinyl alcohol dehydrogenase (cytochrome)